MSAEGRPRLAAACFVVGCLLTFLVELGIARVIGVPMIFAGILLGVVAIASPDFLERDRAQRE